MSRTQSHLRSATSGVLLAVLVAAPTVASGRGLLGFGEETLVLAGVWPYVVPVVLDGAALYAAVLALRAVVAGDSAFGARLLTVVYALASAFFNAWHATDHGGVPAALFFAGASLSAVVLWDQTLRMTRRDQLRSRGLVEEPLPRFRLLRWLVAPVETGRAWRLAVVEQISDPAMALRRAREQCEQHESFPLASSAQRVTEQHAALGEGAIEHEEVSDEQGHGANSGSQRRRTSQQASQRAGVSGFGDVGDYGPDRSGIHGQQHLELVDERSPCDPNVRAHDSRRLNHASKADAVRTAFIAVGGRDIPAALKWLAEHGVHVDRSYAYTVTWSPDSAAAIRSA